MLTTTGVEFCLISPLMNSSAIRGLSATVWITKQRTFALICMAILEISCCKLNFAVYNDTFSHRTTPWKLRCSQIVQCLENIDDLPNFKISLGFWHYSFPLSSFSLFTDCFNTLNIQLHISLTKFLLIFIFKFKINLLITYLFYSPRSCCWLAQSGHITLSLVKCVKNLLQRLNLLLLQFWGNLLNHTLPLTRTFPFHTDPLFTLTGTL